MYFIVTKETKNAATPSAKVVLNYETKHHLYESKSTDTIFKSSLADNAEELELIQVGELNETHLNEAKTFIETVLLPSYKDVQAAPVSALEEPTKTPDVEMPFWLKVECYLGNNFANVSIVTFLSRALIFALIYLLILTVFCIAVDKILATLFSLI